MKNLIIHIGAHKTGSTYIQKLLFDNVKSLLENNILYPTRWTGNLWGHHEVINIIRNGDKEQLNKFFELAFSKVDNVLLSSENFESLTKHQVAKFKSYIPNDINITILYYIRRFTKILPSQWQENVKHGSHHTFPEYLLSNTLTPFRSEILNYNAKIDSWVNEFGRKNIKLISYDNIMDSKGDITDFLLKNIFNIEIPLIKEQKKINTSLSFDHIEIIRILNYNTKLDLDTESLYPRYYYLKLLELNQINVDYLVTKLKNYKKKLSLSDDSYIFSQLHNFLFSAYKDLFLNITNNNIFTSSKQNVVTFIDPSAIADRKLSHEIKEIYDFIKPFLTKEKKIADLK